MLLDHAILILDVPTSPYKGCPFVCQGDFNPFKNDLYCVLISFDNQIYMAYRTFEEGKWEEYEGETVIYWLENY